MKIFLKILAWSGIVLLTVGAIIAFSESWTITFTSLQIGVLFGYWVAFLLGIAGLVLMLIGGLISKPEYFWLASIIAGSLYIISFFSFYIEFPNYSRIKFLLQDLAISVLPGLIVIIEGIWLKRQGSKSMTKRD
ncbi:MAG: hypothetical protein WCX07_04430 [Dehalococcoidales bacterium]|jgi:hypothetical protein|nr:hypothetical protein [Dehalococcoidales bacterium]